MAVVQRNDPNGVAANKPSVFFDVVQYEGKHALQVVSKVASMFPVQTEDDFTITSGLVGE